MKIIPLLGPCGKIPILIRDDDTNFFTQEKMLNLIYESAWKNNFKISFSVIPYQRALDDVCVPPGLRNSQNHYSIEDNTKLCTFLKEKIALKQIEIIQHGVSHGLNQERGEFGKKFNVNTKHSNKRTGNPYDTFDQYLNWRNSNFNDYNNKMTFESYVNIGRNIIKKSLGINPILFVPPYDDFSNENIKGISKLGMIPIYGQSRYHSIFRSPFIPDLLKSYLAKKIRAKFVYKGFIVPFIMSTSEYYQTSKNRAIKLYIPRMLKMNPILGIEKKKKKKNSQPFVRWVNNTIFHCMIERKPICILNHYHHFFYDWNYDSITRKNLFNQWTKILELLNKLSYSWKTNFLELYQRNQKLRKINIAITGQKITINSKNEIIEDVSFKVDRKLDLQNKPACYDNLDENIITVKQLKYDSNLVFYAK